MKKTGKSSSKKDSQASILPVIRAAVADYMSSEGCGCCQGSDHAKHAEALAKLLSVPKYKDGSAYNFSKYRNKKA